MLALIYQIIDAILPSICINCKKDTYHSNLLCPHCANSIIIRASYKKIDKYILFSATDYKDIAMQKLIKTMKYNSLWLAGRPIANIILKHLEYAGLMKHITKDTPVFIVPIPIHFIKKWQRGFNQSEILAKIISKKLNIPMILALRRYRWSAPQNKISSDKFKQANIKNCFTLNTTSKTIPEKSIIIILDDIVTSGSTMKEAALVLRPLRPSKIIFISATSR